MSDISKIHLPDGNDYDVKAEKANKIKYDIDTLWTPADTYRGLLCTGSPLDNNYRTVALPYHGPKVNSYGDFKSKKILTEYDGDEGISRIELSSSGKTESNVRYLYDNIRFAVKTNSESEFSYPFYIALTNMGGNFLTAKFDGNIICNDIDSTVYKTTTISECFTNNMTSDTKISSASFIRVGRSCQLTISLNRKTQCGGGGDICRGYLGSVAMNYMPTVTIRAGSFIGNRAIGTELQANTGLITIRNASGTTISANTGISISVMWIFDGDFSNN